MHRSVTIFTLLFLLGGHSSAHQFTPTYPELKPAYIKGVDVVEMSIFNSREEISWYSINVFDEDWNTLPFASTDKLINLPYLDRKLIEVYTKRSDRSKVVYVCSKSKTLKSLKNPYIITSRICSKIKK